MIVLLSDSDNKNKGKLGSCQGPCPSGPGSASKVLPFEAIEAKKTSGGNPPGVFVLNQGTITNDSLRFYAILRESSEPQERKKGLTRQWRQLNRFCDHSNGTIVHSPQIIESASQGFRLGWQRSIEHAVELHHKHEIDAILFPEVDRETRNPIISNHILKLALDAGVPVFFAEEGLRLDPRDPDSVASYTEAVAKSCAYLATMVRKCRDGRFDRANSDGKLPTNTPMFGFDILEGNYVLNQAQAEAIRQAADIALKAGRTAPAARWLNSQGFRTTRGNLWGTTTLRGLFRNRALIGETVINFREKAVIIYHDPILDVATFESLQDMLDERRRQLRSEVFYCLSGILFCGCGERFESYKGDGGRYYYRCHGHCGEKLWRKEKIELEVLQSFNRYLQERERQQRYLEVAQQSKERLQRDKSEVERDLQANLGDWRTLLEKDLADYPDILVNTKKCELTAEREALLSRQTRIEADLQALPSVDPVDLEIALDELRKPLQMANSGGYHMPYAMSWERSACETLTTEQATALRETLMRLTTRITIKNRGVFLSGRVRVNPTAFLSAYLTVSVEFLP